MKKPEKPQWPQMPMVMTPAMRKFFQERGAIGGNKRNNVVTKQQNAVDDLLLGILAVHVPQERWKDTVQSAIRLATLPAKSKHYAAQTQESPKEITHEHTKTL